MIAAAVSKVLSANHASASPASALNQNIKDQTNMKKFTCQQSGNAPTTDISLDFGAAAAKVARVFEPGEYKLRIESARIVQSNQNVLVALDLIEAESGGRVDRPTIHLATMFAARRVRRQRHDSAGEAGAAGELLR